MKWVLKRDKFLPTCACGCGEVLPRQKYYGKLRLIYGEYPRFIKGHCAKHPDIKEKITGRPDESFEWIKQQGKKYCQCGCGKEIVIRAEHRSKGIPSYVLGHNPNSRDNRRGQKPSVKGRRFGISQSIQILVKSDFRCAECGWGGVEAAHLLEFDHILPISSGGKTTIENGQALCRPCHYSKTGRERAAIRTKNIEKRNKENCNGC